ncbi:imm11 family protein [Nitrospira sp. M1]
MVIKKSVDCVDENKSEFQKFEQNDPVRPDKAGEYRAFMKLRLDANKIVDVAIFRLAKFETAIIINEHIKSNLKLLVQ